MEGLTFEQISNLGGCGSVEKTDFRLLADFALPNHLCIIINIIIICQVFAQAFHIHIAAKDLCPSLHFEFTYHYSSVIL